jgi:multimeric flavodoxin WrbA
MKILAVLGSPRKNSDTLKITQQVETKLKELGEVDFEYLILSEAHLELCKGCFVCTIKGEEYCPLKDDRAKIEEKMLMADGVIFASPAYVFNVSWLMKNFIDRFNYICHRPRFFDQKAFLISTGGGPWSAKECLKRLETLPSAGGFHIVQTLAVVGRPLQALQKPAAREKAREQTNDAAEEFYRAIKEKKRPVPGLKDLLSFRGLRAGTNTAREVFPADEKYWADKGWLDKKAKYFYDTKTGFFKNLFASLMEKQIRRMMNKEFDLNNP